jgi:MoxR-like ATPase
VLATQNPIEQEGTYPLPEAQLDRFMFGLANLSDLIGWGAGPRACQCLVLGGKVRALLRGRTHVTLDDIEALAMPVLRHRIVATFNAEAEGITVEEIVRRVIATVPRGAPVSAL